MFADRARIIIRSGDGGDGHVSFRRELYVPDGGPDGGDGGKGGDVIFEVDHGLNTLVDFHHRRRYAAENGKEGEKRRRHGRSGEDLVIKVPEGTVIKDAATGKVITDMSGGNTREILLRGGRGGLGNMHYATATMQAPKYAKPGKPGMEIEVLLELKVIADVGLIGYPNVGKSTFLSRVSNAEPKIANYHFTTLQPNLGVVDMEGVDSFVIADIPGLIDGASEGVGLGHDFLRHIERTRLLVHLVDISGIEGRDPAEDFVNINRELSNYSEQLAGLPQVVGANKCDLLAPEELEENLKKLRAVTDPLGIEVYPISGATRQGILDLLQKVARMRRELPPMPAVFEKEFEIEAAAPDEAWTLTCDDEGAFVLEGPLLEKMLGYTNLESEKGFSFFQKFLAERGILDELKARGIKEGDTVKLYGHEFDYYE